MRYGRTGRSGFRLPPRPVWLLAGLGVVVWLWGTPHLGWNYQCLGQKNYGGGCNNYIYCQYLGIQGSVRYIPEYQESCGLIKMIPVNWERILDMAR